jgi:hypothetical protein
MRDLDLKIYQNQLRLVSSINFVEEINKLYGISGIDATTMKNILSNQRSGAVMNFTSRWLYWFNSAPDYYWRMNMFLAQAIKDGVLDVDMKGKPTYKSAYQWVDEKLVYDHKKDRRFAYLYHGSANKNSEEYKKAEALLIGLKEKLKNEPYGLDENGNPTRAYSIEERNSMKDFANSAFGYYDSQSKLYFANTIFGRLFSQFKTWLTAKKNTYFLETQISDTQKRWEWVEVENPDGTKQFIASYKGKVMEGIFQTLSFYYQEMGDDVLDKFKNSLNPLKHYETYKSLKDYQKTNLYRLGTDLTIFAMIQLMFLGGDDEEDEWWMKQISTAILRSSTDLWVINNLNSAVGSQNPIASISYTKRLLNDIVTLNGDGILRNVGMTRPIYYIMRDMENSAK